MTIPPPVRGVGDGGRSVQKVQVATGICNIGLAAYPPKAFDFARSLDPEEGVARARHDVVANAPPSRVLAQSMLMVVST